MFRVSDNQKFLKILWANKIEQQNICLHKDIQINVSTSFYPYYEFTRNVAGDSATVEQYLPSGVEHMIGNQDLKKSNR